jgi:hypothetical protein
MPADNEQPKPWDRLDDEGRTAYFVFLKYRNMPANERSVLAVYRALHGHEKSAPSGRYKKWAADYRWVERADAWDAHVEAEAQRKAIEDHAQELAGFRQSQLSMAIAAQAAAELLMQKSTARLSQIKVNRIPAKVLPQFFRAAAAVAAAATDSRAQAIAVDRMLELYNANVDGDE